MDSVSATHRRLEVAANLATLVVCVLIVAVLAKRYFGDSHAERPRSFAAAEVVVGQKVDLDGVDWKAVRGRTMVLVLRIGCRFCSESATFYKTLQEAAKDRASLIAVFGEPLPAAKRYVEELGLSLPIIADVDPTKLGVLGTPTLILADEKGGALRVWRGMLDPSREAEVLAEIASGP